MYVLDFAGGGAVHMLGTVYIVTLNNDFRCYLGWNCFRNCFLELSIDDYEVLGVLARSNFSYKLILKSIPAGGIAGLIISLFAKLQEYRDSKKVCYVCVSPHHQLPLLH